MIHAVLERQLDQSERFDMQVCHGCRPAFSKQGRSFLAGKDSIRAVTSSTSGFSWAAQGSCKEFWCRYRVCVIFHAEEFAVHLLICENAIGLFCFCPSVYSPPNHLRAKCFLNVILVRLFVSANSILWVACLCISLSWFREEGKMLSATSLCSPCRLKCELSSEIFDQRRNSPLMTV